MLFSLASILTSSNKSIFSTFPSHSPHDPWVLALYFRPFRRRNSDALGKARPKERTIDCARETIACNVDKRRRYVHRRSPAPTLDRETPRKYPISLSHRCRRGTDARASVRRDAPPALGSLASSSFPRPRSAPSRVLAYLGRYLAARSARLNQARMAGLTHMRSECIMSM